MRKLLEFIRSIYVMVLFVVLEAIAVGYYAHSTYYTQARLLARSNQVVGGVHGVFAGIRHYFSLGRENRDLLAHVAEMKERLAVYEEAETRRAAGQLHAGRRNLEIPRHHRVGDFEYGQTVRRISSFSTAAAATEWPRRWRCWPPTAQMAGYVVDCTERYSVAMSVLNTSFRASGKLVGADYFGSIYWDGADPHTVVLDELSKYADPQPGQEVVTTGFSQYFPRRRADRLGRKRRAERNPHGVQGARAAGGRNVAPDGCDSGREPRPDRNPRFAE